MVREKPNAPVVKRWIFV